MDAFLVFCYYFYGYRLMKPSYHYYNCLLQPYLHMHPCVVICTLEATNMRICSITCCARNVSMHLDTMSLHPLVIPMHELYLIAAPLFITGSAMKMKKNILSLSLPFSPFFFSLFLFFSTRIYLCSRNQGHLSSF